MFMILYMFRCLSGGVFESRRVLANINSAFPGGQCPTLYCLHGGNCYGSVVRAVHVIPFLPIGSYTL